MNSISVKFLLVFAVGVVFGISVFVGGVMVGGDDLARVTGGTAPTQKTFSQKLPVQPLRKAPLKKQPAAKTPVKPSLSWEQNFTNVIGHKLIWVPAGSFGMGDLSGKAGPDELPVRKVELSGYHLSATEVTQAQWQKVMKNNPSNNKGADLPVERVSWDEAMAYCKRITEVEQKAGRLAKNCRYILPTEAQWERACRAATQGDFAGDLNAMAWHGDNNEAKKTQAVSKKEPNKWGFHDMHGNVWEWCYDFYANNYEGLSSRDPSGPARGKGRVGRGGAMNGGAASCRSANRNQMTQNNRFNNVGFRVAISRVPEGGR